MNTCFESGGTRPVKLEQSSTGKAFKITYGAQVDVTRSYSEAAALLGQALMHRAACDSLLNNENCND